jgi:4'-phosphopantetheinyl transferase EntD
MLQAAAARRARCAAASIDPPLQFLRARLPPDTGLAATLITGRPAAVFAAEERLIARAVHKRRNEFRAGRAAAREALAQIGSAPAAILAHPQRDPIWPAGFIGSITHCEQLALALAVTAPAQMYDAVGIDLEDDSALPQHLSATVCRADERPQRRALAQFGVDHAKLCFVAKEAVFKAIFPRRRTPLRFAQLRVSFHLPDRRFRVDIADAPGAGLTRLPGAGLFVCDGGVVMAAFVMRHGRASGRHLKFAVGV